jgi:putative ABC transport system permease protein
LPNYFAINIPKSSLAQFENYFKTPEQNFSLNTVHINMRMSNPTFYPLIRARLLSINNHKVDLEAEQTVTQNTNSDVNDKNSTSNNQNSSHRTLNRLLNTTYTIQLPRDNHIIEGKWFTDLGNYQNAISVEKGFADRMNIHLGDKLSFQIEEQKIDVIVMSIRQVAWDSFNPNFFVIFAPGIIDQFQSSYMTSFYLPKTKSAFLSEIVKQFPMISLIDIEEIIIEIKSFLSLLTIMLQYLFSFTLLMGLLLLAISLLSTADERKNENNLLRILGASNKTLLMNNFIYYVMLGLLSGIIACVGAIGLGYGFSQYVLHTPFILPMNILWLAPLSASFIICLFGVVGAHTKL